MAIAHPPIPFPGLPVDGALVLPLRGEWMRAPWGETCRIDGRLLVRKHEFHVTLLDRRMVARARQALDEESLRRLFDRWTWAPRPTGRYALLAQEKDLGRGPLACRSIIEHLLLPPMLDFRARLADRLGAGFADPVPHVTHYVQGDPGGIGVPDATAYRRRLVRELHPP